MIDYLITLWNYIIRKALIPQTDAERLKELNEIDAQAIETAMATCSPKEF